MMPSLSSEEEEIQRAYYARTASDYDNMHVFRVDEEYQVALSFMSGMMDYLGSDSILDIGSGTGRVIQHIRSVYPEKKVIGVEPVVELREIGYSKGIPKECLISGSAMNLMFRTGGFDLVCAFGVHHHIKIPEVAIAEMLRVAGKAVFIFDSNNFGQGSILLRMLKQLINIFGLWGVANFIKTKGKGYMITEGDGLAYSYSIFNNYAQVKTAARKFIC